MQHKELAPIGLVPVHREKEIDPREQLLVLVRRRWLIIAVALLIGIVTLIYNLRQTPIYRSTAVLYIDRGTYDFLPRVTSEDFSYQGYDSFFQTQYKLLQSFSLALRVEEKLKLTPYDLADPKQRTQIAKKTALGPQEKEQIAEQFLAMLEISPVKDTALCNISFSTFHPGLSMTLANAWAEEYLNFTLDSQQQYTQRAHELLVNQIRELQKEVDEKQAILQEYSSRKQVVKLDDTRFMSSMTLQDLNSDLSDATKDRISKEVHYNDTKSHRKEAIPEVRNHPVVQNLRDEYAALEDEYSKKSSTFRSDYPELVSLRERIRKNQERTEREMTRIYQEVLETSKAEYMEALNRENALTRQVEKVKKESIAVSNEEFDYDRLRLEMDEKKKMLQVLQQKESETNVSAQAHESKATTIRVVDKARFPKGIFKPNVQHNVLLALGLGLITGISLAFGVEFLDRSIKSHHDIAHHVDLPFLGVIPRYEGGEAENRSGVRSLMKLKNRDLSTSRAVDLLTLYNPESVAAESFKAVRTSLLLSFPESPPSTILITSSRPGEGKTFIASNLAISLAQLDKRVLLVDADMRNPRQHAIWGIPNHDGLSTLLTSDARAKDYAHYTDVEGLRVISSGPHTPRPAELLSSHRFAELLRTMEDSFDHVIIDAPPIMPVADSVILSTKTDCVVFVVQGGVTPRDVVQMSRNRLKEADATIAGIVLNCINLNDPYYYYGYNSYNGYNGKNKNGSNRPL